MKITIEHEGEGGVEVYQNVTDALLVYHSATPVQARDSQEVAFMPVTRSRSWSGGNLRELVKEGAQALDELRAILRERQRANTK